MAFLRKYGTGAGADVYLPIIKRGVVDFAVSADWTPASGDVKISIDGGAAANIGTLPVAVAMGNGAYWKFAFSDAELTGKKMVVTVADSATKAVEDQAFLVETFGHASALYPTDYTIANAAQTGDNYARIGAPAGASVSADVAAVAATAGNILTNTAEIGAAGAGLTAVVAASVTGNVGGNVVGSVGSVVGAVGSVTGAVGSVTGNVGGNVTGSVGSLATQAKADVNAEVDTALADYDPPTRTEATSDKDAVIAAIPAPPTAAAIADAVLDEAVADHLTAGSTGAALNAANAPTAAAVADAVCDELLSGHTIPGSVGKALSDAATGGTVTISYSQVALALAAAVSAGTITLRRGDRISLQITGLGVLPAGRDKLWFTVKSAPVSQADSASIIQVTETGGLLYLNGLVPGTASTEVSALTSADGSLTVDDATDGDVTLVLSAAASALLTQKQALSYDLQYQDGSTVTTLVQGIANVVADVTRAVS